MRLRYSYWHVFKIERSDSTLHTGGGSGFGLRPACSSLLYCRFSLGARASLSSWTTFSRSPEIGGRVRWGREGDLARWTRSGQVRLLFIMIILCKLPFDWRYGSLVGLSLSYLLRHSLILLLQDANWQSHASSGVWERMWVDIASYINYTVALIFGTVRNKI